MLFHIQLYNFIQKSYLLEYFIRYAVFKVHLTVITSYSSHPRCLSSSSISHLIQPTDNYYLVIDYIKSLIEVWILNQFNTILISTALGSNLVVTLIQLLSFELRSHSKSVVLINEVLSHNVRKNDLNSKFALRLRLELIKNLMSGSHLLSHTVSSAVPSAAQALTFVFGMRTGGPLDASPPDVSCYPKLATHAFLLARTHFVRPRQSQSQCVCS